METPGSPMDEVKQAHIDLIKREREIQRNQNTIKTETIFFNKKKEIQKVMEGILSSYSRLQRI